MKIELFNDHFQNFKRYNVRKAQLLIADIPYNVGINAYGSNPSWYKDGDNKNGESELAGKEFFDTDNDFRPAEFMHFCNRLLKKEPKEKGQAPCMIVFCSFEQQFQLIELGKRYGLNKYINLVFRKNFSSQVLKANMRVVGNCEYGLIFYRDKLPKFNNNRKMIFNCIDWQKDTKSEKIHPCLPAGEKVYFNKKWKNIEDVRIGDKNKYGTVIDTSSHTAQKLVNININGVDVTATWNHPFLIKRNNNIYFANAEKIKNTDYVLTTASLYSIIKPYNNVGDTTCENNTKKLKKDISDIQKIKKENFVLNIVSTGKTILEKYHSVCKYTIKTLTGQIISFPICNLSHRLNTRGFTLVAILKKANGLSRVKIVESLRNVIKNIGIILMDGLMGSYVKNVILKNHCKHENFLLQKVGSVKIIKEKKKVYNLTMSKYPIFDTLIGVSHNTQKPIKLIKKLIEVFTDEGDVVIDPTAGSASTLIASLELNRNCYGFEIKKDFYNLAIDRIEKAKKYKEENKTFFDFQKESDNVNNRYK